MSKALKPRVAKPRPVPGEGEPQHFSSEPPCSRKGAGASPLGPWRVCALLTVVWGGCAGLPLPPCPHTLSTWAEFQIFCCSPQPWFSHYPHPSAKCFMSHSQQSPAGRQDPAGIISASIPRGSAPKRWSDTDPAQHGSLLRGGCDGGHRPFCLLRFAKARCRDLQLLCGKWAWCTWVVLGRCVLTEAGEQGWRVPVAGCWHFRRRLDRAGSHLGMALAFVCGDVVLLLKLLATDVAGEQVEGVGVMLLHVPVEGGLLTAAEATDLTPVGGEGDQEESVEKAGQGIRERESSEWDAQRRQEHRNCQTGPDSRPIWPITLSLTELSTRCFRARCKNLMVANVG